MIRKRFDPLAAAQRAAEAARKACGDQLECAALYGSGAMGTFVPARSDLNVAFVFGSLDAPLLEALRPAHREWSRNRLVRPLLLTRAILEASRDTFPLEYLLIRTFHVPLVGPDLFSSVAVERAALRLQVERTLRTQALTLAWSYLDAAGTPAGARRWAGRAATAIAASASGLLHLVGEPIPAARRDLAVKAASRFDMAAEALEHVLLPPGERPRLDAATLFEEARTCVQRLLEAAERLDGPPDTGSSR